MPGFVFDNWQVFTLPADIKDGIDSPLIAFINANNQQRIANIATAQPFTGVQTVYLVSPTRSQSRIPVLEVNSSAGLDVYMAKAGNALAFVKTDGAPQSNGLYILDLASGFSARVLPGANPLVQRGFYMPPAWSPDGQQLALALATGYDIDIYLYAKDGLGRVNITEHGAYDLWPSWSPDGRYIAFVSDRADCPSWIPGQPNFCDGQQTAPPSGGHVYIYEVATGAVRQISPVTVAEPPYWISAARLAFASGDPFDLLNPQRRIWQADIETGEVREARAQDSAAASYLSEAWSPDGALVVAQVVESAGQRNQLALLNAAGELLAQDDGLVFPRFSMRASWAPDSGRVAIGGSAGQCPYGAQVKNRVFGSVANGSPPPTMCDPQFSPDGQYIVFSGVNPRVDGRSDIYVASSNGFGASSLTSDLRGQVQLLGWVGG